jgi:hypothetical protein
MGCANILIHDIAGGDLARMNHRDNGIVRERRLFADSIYKMNRIAKAGLARRYWSHLVSLSIPSILSSRISWYSKLSFRRFAAQWSERWCSCRGREQPGWDSARGL